MLIFINVTHPDYGRRPPNLPIYVNVYVYVCFYIYGTPHLSYHHLCLQIYILVHAIYASTLKLRYP